MVKLSDIYRREVWDSYEAINSPELTAFAQSGIVTRTAQFDAMARGESQTGELIFWRDIDPDLVPNLSDDSDNLATPQKVGQGNFRWRRANLNIGFGAKDIVNEMTIGADTLVHVKNRIEAYWMRRWQRRIINSALGILAQNKADDNGDMVHTAYADVASPTEANLFTVENFTKAVIGTLGDAFQKVNVVAMHSRVYHTIVNRNEVEVIRASDGSILYYDYKGFRIVIDDSLPVTSGTNANKYLCIIFAAGAFAYGLGTPHVPEEVERNARQGMGGGEETFWTRRTWLLHPYGYQVKDVAADAGDPEAVPPVPETIAAPLNGITLSDAELRRADVWERTIDRKLIPLAFLEVNATV